MLAKHSLYHLSYSPPKIELCDTLILQSLFQYTFVYIDLRYRFLTPIPSFLLRKEVIQPQVPLRLPCYDLVPITEFIFGA